MNLKTRAGGDTDIANILAQTTELIGLLENSPRELSTDERALGGMALHLEAALQALLRVEACAETLVRGPLVPPGNLRAARKIYEALDGETS